MKANAFIGRLKEPTERELEACLGKCKAVWDGLIKDLAEQLEIREQDWNSYSPKAGWSLRLQRNKRNIVYLSPCDGSFRAAFIFGENAKKAAEKIKLPSPILKTLEEAKRYPEGFAVRIEVRNARDAEAVKQLAQVKVENSAARSKSASP